MAQRRTVRLTVAESGEQVSAILDVPARPRLAFVLAHGAGAGMTHPFLERLAHALCDRDMAVLRYQFPYLERGRRRPDRPPVLLATVRAAVHSVPSLVDRSLPLIAGGKSMGGRMTSMAVAAGGLTTVCGLVFVGFPLHPRKRPGTQRADHLARIELPMLFLQGTRDELAKLQLLGPICRQLGPKATLHVVDEADHSFSVRARSGRTTDEIHGELADTISTWTETRVVSAGGRDGV